ncbi:hypothetical protein M5K25_027773 [Dendrobium thyrsiflorum]|uniref:Uncharacterized protein n=1 Tax=Dendrobium thyrsiflorum TaxID=117978 RepID=A0ABD0TUN8_DENTH
MTAWPPSFILLYDGELSLDVNFSPTYIGGNCRPLQVSFKSTLKQLKDRVVRVLKYDPSKFTTTIVSHFSVGNEFIPSKVEDDEACEFELSIAVAEVLILYVEVGQIPVYSNFDENLSTQICDSVILNHRDEMQYASEWHLAMPNVPLGSSAPTINEGYETMNSGSSHDVDKEFGDMVQDLSVSNKIVQENINDYVVRTGNIEDGMIATNEYAKIPRSTRQWNAEVALDSSALFSLTNEEISFQINW